MVIVWVNGKNCLQTSLLELFLCNSQREKPSRKYGLKNKDYRSLVHQISCDQEVSPRKAIQESISIDNIYVRPSKCCFSYKLFFSQQ